MAISTHPDPHGHHGRPSIDGPPPGIVDPAQESLVRALRASFQILRVLMVVLVVLYLLSGAFSVGTGEQGLIVRLGRLRPAADGKTVLKPGLHFAWPEPFEQRILLPESKLSLEITTFLFRRSAENAYNTNLAEIVPKDAELKPGVDGTMLTGDRNLSHGLWTIEYRIDDAEEFVRNVGETPQALEPLLQRLAESAIVDEVSRRRVEEVTYEAVESVAAAVQTLLAQSLADLHTGVSVVKVSALTIEPGRVREERLEVVKAENERKTEESRANQQATETLNRMAGPAYKTLLEHINAFGAAQAAGADAERLEQLRRPIDAALDTAGGQVAATLNEARTNANRISSNVRAEYEEFSYYLKQYKKYPLLTALNLWVKMREAVLGNRENEILFVPQGDEIEIWVNRDPERQRRLEEDAIRRKLYPE
jgi:regulator of protease activity HflC (stomatin/prohibitin superfamily)